MSAYNFTTIDRFYNLTEQAKRAEFFADESPERCGYWKVCERRLARFKAANIQALNEWAARHTS